MVERSQKRLGHPTAAKCAAVCIAIFAPHAALASSSEARAGIAPNAAVGCTAVAPSVEPSRAPRPANVAPLQYAANEAQEPSTFIPPAAIFAKLAVSETSSPLRLKTCRLERWFQTSAARMGEMVVIDPRRMVYEIVTTFDHYEGRGGTWGPGFRTFVVDAATGDGIITTTGGHKLKDSLPHVKRTMMGATRFSSPDPI